MAETNKPHNEQGTVGWDDDLDEWTKDMKKFEITIFSRLYNKNWMRKYKFIHVPINIKQFAQCNKNLMSQYAKNFPIIIEDDDVKVNDNKNNNNGKQELDTDDNLEIEKLNKKIIQ